MVIGYHNMIIYEYIILDLIAKMQNEILVSSSVHHIVSLSFVICNYLLNIKCMYIQYNIMHTDDRLYHRVILLL